MSITQVPGFRAAGVACGLKESGQPDLALILADRPCTAAAVFTTNRFKAAPVRYDMALLERTHGRLQGVVINAGNANAVTGTRGYQDAVQMARITEETCHLPPDSVFVMSTGIIGHHLPMDKVRTGIRQARKAIQDPPVYRAAEAIMTTDLVPKEAFVETTIKGQPVKIGAIAKGSGMIHPNMATMLAAIVTDANIDSITVKAALTYATQQSFNRLSVDGDTSTNDTVVILASGQAAHSPITDLDSPEFCAFTAALTDLCTTLAKAVARDGEGATKLIEIKINGAASAADADIAGRTIATSPLVKTALFGNDPNWGRILAALGRSGAPIDPSRVSLQLGPFSLVERGEPMPFDGATVQQWLAGNTDIPVTVNLGSGQVSATWWTCDLSYKYVEINAEYHT